MSTKTGMALLLTLASCGAQAAWLEIGSNDSGTFYVDPPTISRSGTVVTLWYLVDFKTAKEESGGKPFRSSTDKSEYDCQEERSRTMFYNNYAEGMGKGRITFTLKDPLQWRSVAKGSIAEALLKIACGKK